MRVLRLGMLAAAVAAMSVGTANADLTVDFNLGSISTNQNLVGDTTGGNNNAQAYTNSSSALWRYDNPEHVYQFTLADTYSIAMVQNLGGAPDLDHSILSSLTTVFDGTHNVATGIPGGFADESGSLGTFGPGTYYLAIDGYSGNVGGTPTVAQGAYNLNLNLTLIVPPAPACASTDVFCEEFEGGLPAGWSAIDNLGGAGANQFGWESTSVAGTANETGGGGLAMQMNADVYNGSGGAYDGSLVSSSFAIGAGNELSFDYRHRNLGSNFEAILHTSGSGDVSLVSLLNAGNAGAASGDSFSLDLSAYAGETATVEFRYTGDSWDWYAQVDNVRLTPEPGTAVLLAIGVVGLIRRRR